MSPIGRAVTAEEGSWLGSLLSIGAVLGTPLYVFIANRCSRKVTGYLVAVPYLATYTLTLIAPSISVLYIARILAGLGTGATTAFCPMYITEISQDSIRGTLGSFYVLVCCVGILSMYIFGAYLSYSANCYILLATMLVYLLAFYFMPESPVYLINKADISGAKNSLKWLRGSDSDIVGHEIRKLTSYREKSGSVRSVSLKHMLQTRSTRKGLTISLLLVANLQLSAPLAIFSYTATIFKDAGSDLSPDMCSIIVGIIQILAALLATVLLDRAGRRLLLVISNLILSLSLSVLGVYFYLKMNGTNVAHITWLPLICISVYIISLSIGISPVPFVMIPELFMPEARDLAILISLTTMWFFSFLVTKLFTNISGLFGLHGLYWILATFCFVGFLLSIFVFPETKNKSIETIVNELDSKKTKKTPRDVNC